MNKVYDINTKEIREEENGKFLNYLYQNAFGRVILKIIIYPVFSHICGFILRRRISTLYIKSFIKKNKIDMSEYPEVKYKSFDDFFVRVIKEGERNIPKGDKFMAPADSKVLAYKITDDLTFKIKNSIYDLASVLQDNELAKEYKDGHLLIFRLWVDDYHRYAFIDDGEILSNRKIKGFLHTVNPIANERFKIYSENSREVTVMDTKTFGKVVSIEIGALNVGKINNHDLVKFKRGDEKGYFSFGASTVIYVVKKDALVVDKLFVENTKSDIETKVKLGTVIGTKK